MTSRLTKYEKETVLLYNQSRDPVIISTYDPGLRRRLREFAARVPGAVPARRQAEVPGLCRMMRIADEGAG